MALIWTLESITKMKKDIAQTNGYVKVSVYEECKNKKGETNLRKINSRLDSNKRRICKECKVNDLGHSAKELEIVLI